MGLFLIYIILFQIHSLYKCQIFLTLQLLCIICSQYNSQTIYMVSESSFLGGLSLHLNHLIG